MVRRGAPAGWAKARKRRAHHATQCAGMVGTARRRAFAHPTVSVGQFDLVELQFGKVEMPIDLAGPPAHERVMAAVAVDEFKGGPYVVEADGIGGKSCCGRALFSPQYSRRRHSTRRESGVYHG